MITIGEFALSSGLSVKALRFYDERGLLTPAEVDPHSGYRRYSAAQLRTATSIRILRTAGLSVEDVKTAVEEPDRLAELLQNHAADQERRRDLEDRAMALARAKLTELDGPDDGHAPEQPEVPVVRFRTVEATPWVAVVDRLHMDADDIDAMEERAAAAEGHLEQLAAALIEAGVQLSGSYWAGLEPVAGSPAVIDMRLAFPVFGEVPPSFSVPGLSVTTGVLPRREEAFVEMEWDEDGPDLLEGAPGGPLPHPAMITLAELLEERGIDRAEVRQRAGGQSGSAQVGDDGGPGELTMEVAVTVRELE